MVGETVGDGLAVGETVGVGVGTSTPGKSNPPLSSTPPTLLTFTFACTSLDRPFLRRRTRSRYMDQSIDSELCVTSREPWTTRLDAIRLGEAEYAGKVPAACGGLIESIDS